MVPFTILATVMLAALVLAVWVGVREFRRLDPAEAAADGSAEALAASRAEALGGGVAESLAEGPARSPAEGSVEGPAGSSAENSLGIGSESVKKPQARTGSAGGRQVELDGQVWGSS